jgi:hypothetical protein
MQTLLQDLRYGVRMLLKQKSVTAIAILIGGDERLQLWWLQQQLAD